jgi:IS1 family transposase
MDQMDLSHIYRTFHPKTKENTFFSAPHGTFSKIEHIISHKKKLETTYTSNWTAYLKALEQKKKKKKKNK